MKKLRNKTPPPLNYKKIMKETDIKVTKKILNSYVEDYKILEKENELLRMQISDLQTTLKIILKVCT